MSALRGMLATALIVLSALGAGCSVKCDVPYECDIRDRGCQQQVLDALQCVRGGERVEVPIAVVDAEKYADDQVDEIDEEQAEQRSRWYAGLARLDLVSKDLTIEDAVRDNADQVAAFYDSDTREVTVLDRGESLADVGAINLLAHELVHAQQDVEHPFEELSERFGEGFDGELALDAMTEGEASLYAGQLTAYALGFELDDVHWREALRDATKDARADAAHDESPFLQLRWSFAYPFGARYVNGAFEAGGREEVAAIYDAPPVSTRQVLQGYGEAPPGGKPWREPELLEVAVPELLAETVPELEESGDWIPIGTVQYGAYALEVAIDHWLEGCHCEHADVASVAGKLRADALTVLDGRGFAASWRLRFSDEQAAGRARKLIAIALDNSGGNHAVAVLDRDVLVLAMPDRVAYLPDLTALSWGPVPDPDEQDMAEAAASSRGRGLRVCSSDSLLPW